MVFCWGKPIDVAKLEVIRHEERLRRIYWRTVKSGNGSADFDDGIVTFADAGDDGTRVTIVARQRFSLPPIWQAAELELNPELKTAVELWAYRAYFDGTMNNFEACYEGREFRIGRPLYASDDEAKETESDPFAPLEQAIRDLGLGREGTPGKLAEALRAAQRTPAPYAVDEKGFEHFRAKDASRPGAATAAVSTARRLVSSLFSAARSFTFELSEALAKDLGNPPSGRSSL
jgi:hypothetical protein